MYTDTDSLVYHIKTKDFYRDIAPDVKARFDTSNYSASDKRPLPIGINKKVPGMFKDENGGKIMTEFLALRPKMYALKKLDAKVDKKCKGTKKAVVKKLISFEDYKKCLNTGEIQYRIQHRITSEKHRVYTQRLKKIALSSNDDKRLQDRNQTYAHGRGVGIVCKAELLERAWNPLRARDWCFAIDEGW